MGHALRKSDIFVSPGVVLESPTVLPLDAVMLSRNAVRAGVFLMLLQATDAVLTSVGVERFGISVEGNPFLRHFMYEFGHVETLALMKSLAIAVVFFLVLLSNKLPWITKAMSAVSAVYLFGAVIPWTYILFIRPLVA